MLEAHRILVTARSLHSMDSSATRTTEAGEAARGSASARMAVQVEQIKCLLLQALVAALPLLEPAGAGGAVSGTGGVNHVLLCKACGGEATTACSNACH